MTSLIETQWGNIVPLDEYPMFDMWRETGRQQFITTTRDRSDGRFLPVYETETDLAIQRAYCRAVCQLEGIGVGAIGAMKNYTIGTGISVVVRPAKGHSPDPAIVAEIKDFVADFIKRNEIVGDLDAEVDQFAREDGERLLVLRGKCHDLRIATIEPEWLTEPRASRELDDWLGCDAPSTWTFGVHREIGCDTPLGYHVLYDGGVDWEYFSAGEAEHWKRNVPRGAARGVSDAFPVYVDVRRESKLSKNLAAGASARAAIAWIEEMAEGTTRSGAEMGAITAALGRSSVTGEQKQTRYREVDAGTVVKVPNGKRHIAGPDGPSVQGNLEIAAYLLRRFGVRWNAPEYLISGDASNGNFASTLVAESPFVKARESDQAWHGRRWSSLLWKAVKLAYKAGAFGQFMPWEVLRRTIDIDVEFPDVASRDESALTTAVIAQRDAGLISDRTASTRLGNDYDQEVQLGAKRPAPAPAGFPTMEHFFRLAGRFTEGGPGSGIKGHTTPPKVTQSHDSPRVVEAIFKRSVNDDSIAKLGSAGDGANVSVIANSEKQLKLVVEHPEYRATRLVSGDTIKNLSFHVAETERGKGLGAKLFADQVDQAAAMGIKRITTEASGRGAAHNSGLQSSMNGYYTWARLGYDADLKKVVADAKINDGGIVAKNLSAKLKEFPGATKVSDLMKTPEGRAMWKEHGVTFNGTFDLTEGSLSRRILNEYTKSKRD